MNFSSDPINNLENLVAKNKTKSFSIYLVVVFSVLVILFLLPVIKIDISSQSQGIIRSKTDNVPITTIVSGRIIWIALKNNVTVNKGDTLIKISKENLTTEKYTQTSLSVSTSELLGDFNKLLQGNSVSLSTSIARENYLKFQSGKIELQSRLSKTQIEFNRYKTLYHKGIIAKVEFEKYTYELQFAKEALQSYISQQKANWENEKRDLQDRVKNLNGTVSKINVEEKNYVVLAPISGTIENFSGLQVGSFLNASQPIANLSSTNNLIVESRVSPNDIGLIKKNQKVKFQMDAFNYNQWGLLSGRVIDIDKNITIQAEQAYFNVRCSIDSKNLKLQTGYSTEVSKGMTLTTRYLITKRSLFDLLFDKVDDWINPKQLEK